MSSNKRYDNNRILVYSCLHFPFHDKRVFDFLNELEREYRFDRVIDLGDTVDQYSFSRYTKSPAALSASEEIKRAKKCIATLGSIFPKVDVMSSNHCDRLYSRAMINGIPREYIKPYREILEAPTDWKWYKDLSITIDKTRDKVYFCHEKGANALSLAKSISMNVVMGHLHSTAGVNYFNNPLKEMFAVQTGCLVSDKGPPFEYNKKHVFRPVKAACIIIDGVPEIRRLK